MGVLIPRETKAIEREDVYVEVDESIPPCDPKEAIEKILASIRLELSKSFLYFKTKHVKPGSIEEVQVEEISFHFKYNPTLRTVRPETLNEYNSALPARIAKIDANLKKATKQRIDDLNKLKSLANKHGILITIPGDNDGN